MNWRRTAILARRRFRRRFHRRPARRVITLHIGPHKTGTTYIQHTVEANRANLPLQFEAVPRNDRDLQIITKIIHRLRSQSDTDTRVANIRQAANSLAQRYRNVTNLLISHEVILGLIPTHDHVQGLYPFAHQSVPAVVAGLCAGGAKVQVVFYTRAFKDWQESLYRHKHQDNPQRGYNPKRFAVRFGLPEDWRELTQRLSVVLPQDCLCVYAYEKDRNSGLLGRRLFEIWGLSTPQIDGLLRIAPVNVSRPDTKHDTAMPK